MTTRIYGFTALTGGGTGALDKYPEAGMPALATDDYAIGHVSGLFYLYRFDGASAEAESSPDVIAPDSGSGRWILKSLSLNHNDLMNIDGGNVSPKEYYHLASALYNVLNSATAQSIVANPTSGAVPATNVTVAEQTLVGRITGGNVDALSVAQVKTLLGVVSDSAYGAGWDGVTDVAPSKNAVYDGLAPKANPFFTGLLTETSVAAEESAPLGDELLSASGWTSTGWTGDWASGWDHTTGNTTALLNSLAAVSGNYYQIAYTVTGRTAGTFTITFGGVTSEAIGVTGAWGPKVTSTGTLSVTPTIDFDGAIVLSIKQITGIYNPIYKVLNSAAGSALEIRSTTNALYNTFIGVNVGRYNTTGYYNAALGVSALCFNTTGYQNTALGVNALYSNTTGYYNTASGVAALQSNTTGNYNTASGVAALYSNTTGHSNTALGSYALQYNTTGNNNTALGYAALQSNTTGNYNTALGVNALYSNTTGNYNTASGVAALYSNTTGHSNTALGVSALYSNTTGHSNTALGVNAGRYTSATAANETSNNSVYLGYNTRSSASGATNETVIGASAVGNGSNTVTLGNASITGLYCYDTSISSPSDIRIKKNVESLTSSTMLDFVKNLRPVQFNKINPANWEESIKPPNFKDGFIKGNEEDDILKKSDDRPVDNLSLMVGLIAQEVEEAMSKSGIAFSLTPTLPSGLKAMRYGDLIPIIISAVQELIARIEKLEGLK